MTPQQFREAAKLLTEWIADYRGGVSRFPVKSQLAPGSIVGKLPKHPPAQGEDFEQVLRDVNEILMPGVTHWQSPDFYAYFPANASEPSLLGDMVSSALGVQGMLWETSPACTELEIVMMDWLAEMQDLPAQFRSSGAGGGVIQDSASSASLCAILSARERATNFKFNEEGGKRTMTAYTSAHAHSSIEKDIKVAGIGSKHLRTIDVDSDFVMRPDLLEQAIVKDKSAGHLPFFVCATVGTTSTLAIDPLPAIGDICKRHGLWLHVDAAMAGTAAICPEFRYINRGLEAADSYVFDAHKWMFTNFDCSCYFVADRKTLIHTLNITPEYLRNAASESGEVTDYRDWHVPLGRRFRALKLWFVIRHYGVEGLRHHIRRHVELTSRLAEQIRSDRRFEIVAPVSLNLICFRFTGTDKLNEDLHARLNNGGKIYLSHTKLNGRYVLRICIGQTHTEKKHVDAAWRLIQEEAGDL